MTRVVAADNLLDKILDMYRSAVKKKHPDRMASWPIISGCNRRVGQLQIGLVIIFDHSGAPGIIQQTGLGSSLEAVVGPNELTSQTVKSATAAVEKAMHLRPVDGVVCPGAPDQVGRAAISVN
jgi:hypothetical protein